MRMGMEMVYSRDGFGTVNLRHGEDLVAHHDPSDELSFLVVDGSIMKHGRAELVGKYIDGMKERAAAVGQSLADILDEYQVLTVRAMDLSDEMLSEISACLATTGRAAGLAERLTELRDAAGLPQQPGFSI